jgi:hypothetical protein
MAAAALDSSKINPGDLLLACWRSISLLQQEHLNFRLHSVKS